MSAGFNDADSQVVTNRITTSDATPTAIYTFVLPTNYVGELGVTIVGRKSDGGDRAKYSRSMVIYRAASSAGNDTVRTVGTDYESDSSWDATISRSTNTISVLVTGAAATAIKWTARVTLVSG